jgi:hypothetical protein
MSFAREASMAMASTRIAATCEHTLEHILTAGTGLMMKHCGLQPRALSALAIHCPTITLQCCPLAAFWCQMRSQPTAFHALALRTC